MTRIVLIHAYAPSMPPIISAFRDGWPQAQTLNLLDETLYADVSPDGMLPAGMIERVACLFRHARESGADGIVFTGSTFGPAVEAARKATSVPTLKADEAMCAEAVARGSRILVITTAARALPVISANLQEAARGRRIEIETLCVEGAKAALERGETDRHDGLIAEAVEGARDYDVALLGQASMAPVRQRLSESTAARILTGPEATVARLRAMISV